MLHPQTPGTEWTNAVIAGDLDGIRASFRDTGAEGPDIIWSPRVEDIPTAPLQVLFNYWQDRCVDGQLPRIGPVDPRDIREALGYQLMVDVIDGGEDFRYRLYGSTVAAISGFDMTGRLLSEHQASSEVIKLTFAVYRAAIRQREAVILRYRPARARLTWSWYRLILPMVDDTGAVCRFLSGNVPISRTGKPLTSLF